MRQVRYERNLIITDKEQENLARKTVAIIGLGGLGGITSEMILRMGVKNIILVDYDVVSESNLNRQLVATEKTIGKNKVDVAVDRLKEIDKTANLIPLNIKLDSKNAPKELGKADLLIDCVDSVKSKYEVYDTAKIFNIPMIHGALHGWYGQVSTIYPKDDKFKLIYKDKNIEVDSSLGNPSFIPNLISSIQVSEAIKVLLGKEDTLRGKLLLVDLLENEFKKIEL